MKTYLNLYCLSSLLFKWRQFLLFAMLWLLALTIATAQPSKDEVVDCPAPCPCEGHFTQLQVYYFGEDNVDITVYEDTDLSFLITSFSNVNAGQLLTVDAAGTADGILGAYTYFVVNSTTNGSCVERIYSRCPSNAWPGAIDDLDVLGQTFGDFTVYSRTDEGNNFACDISNAKQDWHVGGNIVGPSNNILGTRNDEAVVFITGDEARGTITNTGNFGINTLSPSAILDVQGDVLIGETLDVHGITSIHNTTGSSSSANGALVVAGGAGIGQNLNIAQDTRTGQDLFADRDAAIGRNASVGQDLNVGMDAEIGNNVRVGGQAEIAQSMTVHGTSTLNGFTRVNNDARITGDLDLDGQLVLGFGNSKRLASTIGGLLLENQSGDVLVEADDELMLVVSNTQVEVKKRLIVTGGSDLAEGFTISSTHKKTAPTVIPGMILSIDSKHPGQLKVSQVAHDRTVAGIVSGAGGINTGMILGQPGTIADGEVAVALTGRAYALVDASYGPIKPGDLLTTSPTTGHAMKVTDFSKAQGSIIGKAMTSLEDGQGLVLVLISLQ